MRGRKQLFVSMNEKKHFCRLLLEMLSCRSLKRRDTWLNVNYDCPILCVTFNYCVFKQLRVTLTILTEIVRQTKCHHGWNHLLKYIVIKGYIK